MCTSTEITRMILHSTVVEIVQRELMEKPPESTAAN